MRIILIPGFSLLLLAGCRTEITDSGNREDVLRFHNSLITIDSHTDTPLQFTRPDFDFGEYHDPVLSGSKIDLPRLDSGMLDGIFMAVFIGQRERNPEGNIAAEKLAREIFDSIYSTVEKHSESLDLAYTIKDLKRNSKKHIHSVFIGIENGYAIGNNLHLIDTFYNMGARYITLCHSLNNDICDSSTDSAEHNGLSAFGVEVVRRMNRTGMMIDVSHASDSSFYDILKVSRKPVIASHSSSRAVCNNLRNLSDGMLKALAKNDGVVQVCILSAYIEEPLPDPQRDSAKNAVQAKHGNFYELDTDGKRAFLRDWYAVDREFPPRLANVSRVVDHIDHIVEVAGIDHVGIGTDFDGGGGVEGCFDVSEIMNITEELLKRGYTERDIRKIWGQNLMRVMRVNTEG